jgi:hypothetical protein
MDYHTDMVISEGRSAVQVGDEIWIAVALLHREHPDRADFTRQEIEQRLRQEHLVDQFRPGVTPHIYLHCVANRPPNPRRLRMLTATDDDRRRLFRLGDPYDRGREGPLEHTGTRIVPDRASLPEVYRPLIDWYFSTYSPAAPSPAQPDPILSLRGLGKDLWDEQPDEYVHRLRAGWE